MCHIQVSSTAALASLQPCDVRLAVTLYAAPQVDAHCAGHGHTCLQVSIVQSKLQRLNVVSVLHGLNVSASSLVWGARHVHGQYTCVHRCFQVSLKVYPVGLSDLTVDLTQVADCRS